MKTGFDLDGVFIPDCDHIPDLGTLEDFLKLTRYMQPTFKPIGEWSIITGRSIEYASITNEWVNAHFTNKPTMIWHKPTTIDAIEHKVQTINEQNFTHYVESDYTIVQHLRHRTNAIIRHFASDTASNFWM
jgi:hypothetical protein